jgi:antitoxin ParD1/3/4
MADSLAMTVHLSPETREFIRKKVEGGEYASESEFVADSLESLREDAEEQERWERETVLAARDELDANPASGLSYEQVLESLAKARRERASVGHG